MTLKEYIKQRTLYHDTIKRCNRVINSPLSSEPLRQAAKETIRLTRIDLEQLEERWNREQGT